MEMMNYWQAKEQLYNPWMYYGNEVEDRVINKLFLLDLIEQSPPSSGHEQQIRAFLENDPNIMRFGPGGLLLGILIKYHASRDLILDLLRLCPALLYQTPENPKRLCLLGFAFYVDADPNLIRDMMIISGFRKQQIDPTTVSWNRVRRRSVSMLCQDDVREQLGPEEHDRLLMMLVSKPATHDKDNDRFDLILHCWRGQGYTQMRCLQMISNCLIGWVALKGEGHSTNAIMDWLSAAGRRTNLDTELQLMEIPQRNDGMNIDLVSTASWNYDCNTAASSEDGDHQIVIGLLQKLRNKRSRLREQQDDDILSLRGSSLKGKDLVLPPVEVLRQIAQLRARHIVELFWLDNLIQETESRAWQASLDDNQDLHSCRIDPDILEKSFDMSIDEEEADVELPLDLDLSHAWFSLSPIKRHVWEV